MKLSLNKRQTVLGVMLSLTLVAVGGAHFRGDGSPDVVLPVARERAASHPAPTPVVSTAAAVDSLDIAGLRQNQPGVEPRAGQVFASKSWYVPPPPPPRAPPPPPSAPPLPFTFVGSILNPGSDGPKFFVYKNDKLYQVEVGDVIEGAYRLDEADDHGLTFIYLPMNVKQTLRIPG